MSKGVAQQAAQLEGIKKQHEAQMNAIAEGQKAQLESVKRQHEMQLGGQPPSVVH